MLHTVAPAVAEEEKELPVSGKEVKNPLRPSRKGGKKNKKCPWINSRGIFVLSHSIFIPNI
jgi:hypothetical protein